MAKEDSALYGFVKQSIKLLKKDNSITLSFCFIEEKQESLRRIFYVDKKKGTKPAKFATVKKISAFLSTLGFSKFGTKARCCAGFVTCSKDSFSFEICNKVGISPAQLLKGVKKLNTLYKLGLGSISILGSEEDRTLEGLTYAQYETKINAFYKQHKAQYPLPSQTLSDITSTPPLPLLEELLGYIGNYEEKEPNNSEDIAKPQRIRAAEEWLYAYLYEVRKQNDFQKQMGLDPQTFAQLDRFYRYVTKNATALITPLFNEEANIVIQKAQTLNEILPPELRTHLEATLPIKPVISDSLGQLFLEENIPLQTEQFLRSFTVEATLKLEDFSIYNRHLSGSNDLRIALQRLFNEYILLPYQSRLQNLMRTKGSVAVSAAEKLHQELDGAAKADRVHKALFTVLKTKKKENRNGTAHIELIRKNDNKLEELNTLARHLEGSAIGSDVNDLIQSLKAGSSDLFPGIEVHVGSFISLEAIIANRFGGFKDFSVEYLTDIMKTGTIRNVWSLINSLGLVANSNIQIPLALDILSKLSPAECKEALNKPKVRALLEDLIRPKFFGSQNNYTEIFTVYLNMADSESNEDTLEAKGNRIAVQFYCMVHDGYENLDKAISMLKLWLEQTELPIIQSLKSEFIEKFQALADLSFIASKFNAKNVQHCTQIIQTYIDQNIHLHQITAKNDLVPKETITAIANIQELIQNGSKENLNISLQQLNPEQKDLYILSLLDDESQRLDLQNPSLNEDTRQNLSQKAIQTIAVEMKKKGCNAAEITDMESALLFDAPKDGLHAKLRRDIKTLPIAKILTKIHEVPATEIDTMLSSLKTIINDNALLTQLWNKGPSPERNELFGMLGITYHPESNGFISQKEVEALESEKDCFILSNPENMKATQAILSTKWHTLSEEQQNSYGNENTFISEKMTDLDSLSIGNKKISGMRYEELQAYLIDLRTGEIELSDEEIGKQIELIKTALQSIKEKETAHPLPINQRSTHDVETIQNQCKKVEEDPNFWGAQINTTLAVMIRTDTDLNAVAQLVYKAQDSIITAWHELSETEKKQYSSKEDFISEKMNAIWSKLSPDVQSWLNAESITSKLGGNQDIKHQIGHSLKAYSSSTALSSETMLMQRGERVDSTLTDIESAFALMSTFELLEKYSSYRILQPKTDEMSLIAQQRFSRENQALQLKSEIGRLEEEIISGEDNPSEEQTKKRQNLEIRRDEKKTLYETLRIEVEEDEEKQTQIRSEIDGFTLDVRPDQIEKLWNSGGWGRSKMRKVELLNLVRSKIAHHSTTELGRTFLKEKLPGYAIDALSSNKLFVLSDMTKQKSKDTGVQWDFFSNASSMRKEGGNRLLGEVRQAHEALEGKSDTEREELRNEAAERIQEKREELNARTEAFDEVRVKATQITIAVISIIASIAVGIASAGIGSIAAGFLVNTLLVASKAILVEGVRSYLKGDEVALRESVARIAAATIIEHLGAHIGGFAGDMAALSNSDLEDSALDHFISNKLHIHLQDGVLSKVIVQYPIATGLAAAAGSSVGATAAVLAENEGGLRGGLRDLKETMISEIRNFDKSLFIELTKTVVTDSDIINQDTMATFATHDSIASEVVSPVLNKTQARFMHFEAIKKMLHSDIEELDLTLSSLEDNLTNLVTIRASLSLLKKNLDRRIASLEGTFDSIYDSPDGKNECKDKIKRLYRLQKSFQDNFFDFTEKRDEILAQKELFFKSINTTKKEIKKSPTELLSFRDIITSKLDDAKQKTTILPKIEKWIKKVEPFLNQSTQRIAEIRKRYDAKKRA